MSQSGNPIHNTLNEGVTLKINLPENGSVQSSHSSWEPLQGSTKTNKAIATFSGSIDLICLSHLRWDFVYQRPQHLLSRCAKVRRVFFIEEPLFSSHCTAHLEISIRDSGVWVVVPHLPEGLSLEAVENSLKEMLDNLLAQVRIQQYVLWYYTPMSLGFTRHLDPLLVIYDCMDELSAFKGASPILKEREAELFKRANLVFTGGQSLYEAKRNQHSQVYAFPSSIDRNHFAQARTFTEEQADQKNIPNPRLGFFGVIDERFDIELLAEVAKARPDWHFVILGPVVKIDPSQLPHSPNIHYLGGKSYQDLPSYIAGWDIAILPFARNESTRFISPTKTPEYLAAGKPVVSTSIRDVVRPYGNNGLVEIADTVTDFVTAVEKLLQRDPKQSGWLNQVDTFLANTSWDSTWLQMMQLIQETLNEEQNSKNNLALFTTELTARTANLTRILSRDRNDLLSLE